MTELSRISRGVQIEIPGRYLNKFLYRKGRCMWERLYSMQFFFSGRSLPNFLFVEFGISFLIPSKHKVMLNSKAPAFAFILWPDK